MKVDLDEIRSLGKKSPTLAALLAVVDAARHATRRDGLYGKYADVTTLVAALEPFTPERPDRAWEEVDRWNAQQRAAWGYLARVREEVDAKPNPRDRARDQLADAGVVVQRQFQSDQERIAELERERDALRKELDARRSDVRELETTIAEDAADAEELVDRVEALKRERDEWRAVVSAARMYARGASVESWYALKDALASLDGEKP